MTRSARKRRDRVTVDELLRQTGERARRPGSRAAELAARRGTEPAPRPSGVARMALASAVIVVLGGLVIVLAMRPDAVPGDRDFPQLQPATAVPTSTAPAAVPTETSTPSPVVMHARRTPTPTVTVELPPPATTKPSAPPSTRNPGWNPYQCYPYYCGPYSGGPQR
jgi:hypothetical protein